LEREKQQEVENYQIRSVVGPSSHVNTFLPIFFPASLLYC
jgi:hypothetical protein